MNKIPMPGYFLAILDSSQLDNVDFAGDDKFDMPNSGTMILLNDQDKDKPFKEDGTTYGSLIDKRVFWAKYAEADAFFHDSEVDGNVVFISLEKLRGYEN